MLTKLLGKYVKFVVVFTILGFVGVLAYLMIRARFVEDTIVTAYEIAKPVKRESYSNSHLPSGHSREQEAQTIETSKRQTAETNGSPTSSDTHQADVHLNGVDIEEINQSRQVSSATPDVEDSGTTLQHSGEELRRQVLRNRQKELQKEIEALAGEDGRVALKDTLKGLALLEEIYQIEREFGTLNSGEVDPFAMIKRGKFITSHTTKDGQVPVSIGSQLAEMYEDDGLFEVAENMRILTQRALQNGDEFFKPEHLEGLR